MANWFIIQSLEAYSQHPELIGCRIKEETKEPIWRLFKEIKRGDKVAYYATGYKVIIGVFEVVSDKMEILTGDKDWNEVATYEIKPDTMPKEGNYLDFKGLLISDDVSFKLFPEKNRWQYKIWNQFIHRLPDKDLMIIKQAINNSKHIIRLEPEDIEGKVLTDRLGTPVSTIDLLFEPIDEMGVVFLFASYHRRLGFPFVIKLRQKFPDALAINEKGETKRIELEYRASSFLVHQHPKDGCDYVICWDNDLDEGALGKGIEIIPLKEALADIFAKR